MELGQKAEVSAERHWVGQVFGGETKSICHGGENCILGQESLFHCQASNRIVSFTTRLPKSCEVRNSAS